MCISKYLSTFNVNYVDIKCVTPKVGHIDRQTG